MVLYSGEGTGRVLVLGLKRGDLLLESIVKALKDANIRDAIITGAIGSLQKAVLHRVIGTGREPEDEFITLERPMELASLQGLVVDGEPHFHMVVSDTDSAYTGHLENGTTVLYLTEITLLEVSGLSLARRKNEDNIATLTPR